MTTALSLLKAQCRTAIQLEAVVRFREHVADASAGGEHNADTRASGGPMHSGLRRARHVSLLPHCNNSPRDDFQNGEH